MTKTTFAILAVMGLAFAASPVASATDYSACDPDGNVCVYQHDGSPGNADCGPGVRYGSQQATNGARLDTDAADAHARAGSVCNAWFIRHTHTDGFLVQANVADAASVDARWLDYTSTRGFYDLYNEGDRSGTVLSATAEADQGTVGFEWRDETFKPRGLRPRSSCDTDVYTAGAADQSLGCPLGDVPDTPDAPFGAILP